MGYDVCRFSTEVDQEFICSICQDVFCDPRMIASCEHIFCATCITDCWSRVKDADKIQCPIDRETVQRDSLKRPLRAFCNLLDNLCIKCEFEGCELYAKLDQLDDHLHVCQFNPTNLDKDIKCPRDCGAVIKVKDTNHDCVQYLRKRDKERSLQATTELKSKDAEIRKLQDKIKLLEDTNRLVKAELAQSISKSQTLDVERCMNYKKEIETKDQIISFKTCRIAELEALVSNNTGKSNSPGSSQINLTPATPSPSSSTSNRSETRFHFWRASSANPSSNENGNLIDIGPSPDKLEPSSRFYDQNNKTANDETKVNNGSDNVSTLSRMFGRLGTRSGSDQQLNQVVTSNSGCSGTKKQGSSPKSALRFLLPGAGNTPGSVDARKLEKREEDYEKTVSSQCKSVRLRNILTLFPRRLFFAGNDFFQPVKLIDRNAHAFSIFYEIKLLEIVARYLSRESRVLDIGCGHGFLTCCLTELAKHVVGLDHSRELVERAREIVETNFPGLNLTKQIVFVHADGRSGCARHKPYDMIIIEPMVKRLPDDLVEQLTPTGCIIAALKHDSSARIVRYTRNELRTGTLETLSQDSKFILRHNRDLLCDFGSGAGADKSNVGYIFNKLMAH